MDKLIAAFLGMLLSFNVSAVDAAYVNMQRAMGGIIQDQAVKRGVSTTDPRTYGTLYGAGKAAAAGAAVGAGTALVVGTSPAWGTVLAISAISGAISYGVAVGLDSLVRWAFSDPANPKPIMVSGSSSGSADPLLSSFAPMVSGGAYYSYYWSHAGSAHASFYAWFRDPSNGYCGSGGANCAVPANMIVEYQVSEEPWGTGNTRFQVSRQSYYSWDPAPGFTHLFYATPGYIESGAPASCASGESYSAASASCVGIPLQGTSVNNDGEKTLQEAIEALTETQRQEKLSYESMALLINLLVNKAAQEPDYAGLPVSLYEPFVTAADVAAWDAANPGSYPTVEGLVTPVANPSVDFAPSTVSAPGSAVAPAVSPVPQGSVNPTQAAPKVDLGADPVIGAPGLEEIPTAAQILAPLLGMFPDFRGYVVPDHNAVCPAPSGDLFGQSFVLDGHCNLLDGVRPTLTLVMAAVWLMLSTFVVLRA